jgi:pectin methylesterase-like acyl-CoA thioesterase
VIRAVGRFSQPGINHSNIGAAEQHCWIFHGKRDIAVKAGSYSGSLKVQHA